MNLLTLFNGLSGLHLACDVAGVKVDNCYYAEIDKYANMVTAKHYPNDVALGDVTKWREWNIDWSSIDLVGAGFPCQAWSVAGQQLGDKDERGMLFWTTLEIISEVLKHNPKAKFLMENVKMKKEFEEYITHHTTEALGYVEKTLINSALVSAQNRNRYYWTNFKVTQPGDKGILLRDILEDNTSPEFNLSDEAIAYMGRLRNGKPRWEYHKNPTEGKAACLTANMYKGVPYGVLQLRPAERIKEGNEGHVANATDIKGHDILKRVYGDEGKAPTLSACSGGNGEPKVLVNQSATKSGKAYTLTSSQGNCVAWNSCERKQRTMVPVCESDNVEPNVYNGVLYRKLTPVECERLQTIPDNYTAAVENNIYSLYNYKETDKEEDLYLCDVKLMGVKEKQEQKSKVTYALCTTKDLLDMDLLSYQRLISIKTQSVNIVIEKLGKKEVGLEGCVVDITKTGLDMETLYMQIKSSLNLGQEGTKNALMVKTSTGKLLRIISVESCQEMRLFTILIAIKLITQLRICMYVKDRANIHYCIDSLKESQGNLLSVVLSSLRMETTEQTVSNTQRYKMIGNGWTISVIAHILKDMLND